ncbi:MULTISPECIES: AraC family transcriptional regulator [Pseudomonas]|uniref:AraC family transcriptional regulator n=1 Tax=Pseudomonas TaxID=286 RepID=UPI002DB72F1B|nr:AraC family transcriptional regulator [Pseudomonas asiatica]MEB6588000.1 AraC family transcriptional regulator [Pseudomonas asiatica]
MKELDWLCHFQKMIAISGQLEERCVYRAPWSMTGGRSSALEIPYHIVLNGRATIEDIDTGEKATLTEGDVVLLLHGTTHALHDGSGYRPHRSCQYQSLSGWMLSENDGHGERLEMLCGRLFIDAPHDRLLRVYFPRTLIVKSSCTLTESLTNTGAGRLASLIALMHGESSADKSGGHAVFKALSAALFTLVIRTASESGIVLTGLLAVTGSRRFEPAISAMFSNPARDWNLPDLSKLCNMSRTTFMRRFQGKLGCSAFELLTDIRLGLAANALSKTSIATESIAASVGYRSVSAFRRVFCKKLGMTPRQWRRMSKDSGALNTPRDPQDLDLSAWKDLRMV